MIKNIVFDMGKVLVNYDADRVCNQVVTDILDHERVKTALFLSPEWIMLDMGVLADEQALQSICGRLPERLHEAVKICLRDWHLYNMWPVEGMEEVIRGLKKRGFGLYVCSNAAIRLKECYRDVFPAPDAFDGILFSADVKYIKPQKDIYEVLFDRFSLDPRECFFIDDLQGNIDGAAACGMKGYCHADGDLDKLKQVLAAIPDPNV